MLNIAIIAYILADSMTGYQSSHTVFPQLILFSQQSQNLREFAQVRISGMVFTTIKILSKVEFILERCFWWPHQI